MPELLVTLSLTPDMVAAYYRGEAPRVVARATNGQTVQFPTSVLHKFIATDGIHGRFRIVFDDAHKFVRIEPAPVQPAQ